MYTLFNLAQFLGFVEVVRREGPREDAFLQAGNPQGSDTLATLVEGLRFVMSAASGNLVVSIYHHHHCYEWIRMLVGIKSYLGAYRASSAAKQHCLLPATSHTHVFGARNVNTAMVLTECEV